MASKTLYISGIKQYHTEEDLWKHFEYYGAIVECIIPLNPETKKSQGYAWVEFKRSVDAALALADQHHTINGKSIQVRLIKIK